MTWQPIESAPRDGKRILSYAPDAIDLIAVGSWYRKTWRDDGYEPTHWMPLPDPPVQS